jgi:hypothetical protein
LVETTGFTSTWVISQVTVNRGRQELKAHKVISETKAIRELKAHKVISETKAIRELQDKE